MIGCSLVDASYVHDTGLPTDLTAYQNLRERRIEPAQMASASHGCLSQAPALALKNLTRRVPFCVTGAGARQGSVQNSA